MHWLAKYSDSTDINVMYRVWHKKGNPIWCFVYIITPNCNFIRKFKWLFLIHSIHSIFGTGMPLWTENFYKFSFKKVLSGCLKIWQNTTRITFLIHPAVHIKSLQKSTTDNNAITIVCDNHNIQMSTKSEKYRQTKYYCRQLKLRVLVTTAHQRKYLSKKGRVLES